MFLFLLCPLCLCGVLGCGYGYRSIPKGKDPNPPFQYISATLTISTAIYNNDDWIDKKVVVKITDPAEVTRFVKFFPGVGTKQESDLHGLWLPLLKVTLTRIEDGNEITVRVIAVDKYWMEDQGDHGEFLVRGNLKEYLKNLVEGKTINANKVKH